MERHFEQCDFPLMVKPYNDPIWHWWKGTHGNYHLCRLITRVSSNYGKDPPLQSHRNNTCRLSWVGQYRDASNTQYDVLLTRKILILRKTSHCEIIVCIIRRVFWHRLRRQMLYMAAAMTSHGLRPLGSAANVLRRFKVFSKRISSRLRIAYIGYIWRVIKFTNYDYRYR